ncbi:MAG: DUF327 family protein, partial [Lachnospiraceae bacterium]|nr:DUF327 family protein [Lachnospiraceae bacterium]
MDIRINQVNQTNPIQQTPEVQQSDDSFKFMLMSNIEEKELQQVLASMMQEIEVQGKKLAKHRDIRDMKQYRKLIK